MFIICYHNFYECYTTLTIPLITSLFSSKALYDYELKGNFNHAELFSNRKFYCKMTKSGNLHCKVYKQIIWPDIEGERQFLNCYEDEDSIIYEIENTNVLSAGSIGNIFYYCILVKLKKDKGLVLPGTYIAFFGNQYAQKIIFAKKNTRTSKNKFPKLSKYLQHAQPLNRLVKLLVKKEKKLRPREHKRLFLRSMLKFSKYLKIGSIFYAKEGISVNESFSFNSHSLPYDSFWFDFSFEMENFCCLLFAWFYIHVNKLDSNAYNKFADCHFLKDKDFLLKIKSAAQNKSSSTNAFEEILNKYLKGL